MKVYFLPQVFDREENYREFRNISVSVETYFARNEQEPPVWPAMEGA